MDEPGYTLEKYAGPATRYTCPNCNKRRVFSRYINATTSEYLDDHVGRCNREIECGYHYKPKDYFQENPMVSGTVPRNSFVNGPFQKGVPESPVISLNLPWPIVQLSLKNRDNNLVQFFNAALGATATNRILEKYHVGTSKRWPGSTVFWQVDTEGHVRTGKVMLYNSTTGKRVKEPFNKIDWAHSILMKSGKIPAGTKVNQCLFGEHLANTKPNEIVIVESEKTALIGSAYLPEFTWMACGGLSNLSCRRLYPIKRFPIILHPDLRALQKWQAKATELTQKGFMITVSSLLERSAQVSEGDRANGLDLGDFLLRHPVGASPEDKA